MQQIEPKVFLIAETKLIKKGMKGMLTKMDVPDWKSDGASDTEVLIEAAGKLCYASFDTKLNKNLTKTGGRNNFDYITQGIIGVGHGSVVEHATVSIAFMDVSRIMTHELVRHRAGCAYSQTSGRYVRTDVLKFFIPRVIRDNPDLHELFVREVQHQEATLRELESVSRINTMKNKEDFTLKKWLTSAFRRVIGNGQSNNIIGTFNHRALRNIIQMRTSRHAEEEIRKVFNDVFVLVHERYPSIYDDACREFVDGMYEITFSGGKV